MQIKKVRIKAFGPFVDQDLELAPGMTVIYGPNEAGKTTWHAALYAGLCGIRRGRGAGRVEDRAFAALHRPWDGPVWQVGLLLKLADGREIELQHDLDGRVACRATDMQLGRDVSDEIMNDGSPDGSVWLGLDRRAFLATACVGQAEILTVRTNPDELQEHLQRAAATAGTDETAARALEMLESYKSEEVGLQRANSTKPLQKSITRVAAAQRALESAQLAHEQYVTDADEVEKLEEHAAATSKELAVFDAAVTRRNAEDMKVKLDRATVLEERYAGLPPPDLAGDEELARDVAGAVTASQKIAVPAVMEGPTAGELREQLSELPAGPSGDLAPDPAVVTARNAAVTACAVVAQLLEQKPAEPEVVAASVTDQELRDLARDIEASVPAVDPVLLARRQMATEQLAASASRKINRRLLVPGIVLTVVGVLAAILFPPSAIVAIAGVVLVALALVRRGDGDRLDALQTLVTLDAEGGAQLQTAEAMQRRKDAAIDRLRTLELPEDPATLLDLAAKVAAAAHQRALLDNWERLKTTNEDQAARADQALVTALTAGGVPTEGDAVAAADQYVSECADRAREAELAGKRSGIEGQIVAQEHLETITKEAEDARDAALVGLRQAAERCGLADAAPGTLVEQLNQWLSDRAANQGSRQVEVEERAELEGLLGEQALEDLAKSVRLGVERADQLEARAAAEDLAAVVIPDDWEGELRRLGAEARKAGQEADEARGRLAVLTKQLPSVAEAEEALTAAETERARVEQLQRTLDTTINYLEEAQERVHRDIAPVLAESLQAWLPHVTGDRYVEATVDPEELSVQVRGKDAAWRDAQLLSHGTREQIYLLLRMAMVQHLTAKDECAPLILDDVTVQCDTSRTAGLLDLLHTISADRQIILFSQEDDVHGWAEGHLGEAQDSLLVLDAIGVPA